MNDECDKKQYTSSCFIAKLKLSVISEHKEQSKTSEAAGIPCWTKARLSQLRKEISVFCDQEKVLYENGTGSPEMSLWQQ